jgi:hypothetical protein
MHRHQAALLPATAQENRDMGDLLHSIISSTMSDGQEAELPTLDDWRNQTIHIYFQNVNGL